MNFKQALSTRHFRDYDVVEEVLDAKDLGGKDFAMKSAYSKSGDYIGEPRWAHRAVNRYGIQHFEKRAPSDCVCSIGYSPRNRKWYGWSHRAIFGFKPGSHCKKGNCGYTPKKGEWTAATYPEAKQMAMDFAEGVS